MNKTTLAVMILAFAQTTWGTPSKRTVNIVFNVDQKASVCWFESDITPVIPPNISSVLGCPSPNFSAPQLGSFLNVLEFVAAPDSPGAVLCDGGDSGGAMVSRSTTSFGAIVGILFAASLDGTRGLAVPLGYIQRKFSVDLA